MDGRLTKETENALLRQEIELLREQVKTYEEDFLCERHDRERAHSQKLEAEARCTKMLTDRGGGQDHDLIHRYERKIGGLEEQIRSSERMRETLQGHLKDLRDDLQKAHDQILLLSNEKARFVMRIEHLETQNRQLHITVSSQEARNAELKRTIVHNVLPTGMQVHSSHNLQYQLDESKLQCSSLLCQLQASQRSINELERRCQSLGHEVECKESEKRSLERNISCLESRNQGFQEELARLASERNREETDHKNGKRILLNRLREATREKDDLERRLEQVENDNRELGDKVTDLTRKNNYLCRQQESVHLRVSSRLQETGESLRHHQSTMQTEHSTHERLEGVKKLETDVQAILDILRDLHLTGDRKTMHDAGKGSQSSHLSPDSSPHSNRTLSPSSPGYNRLPLSFPKEQPAVESSDSFSWDDMYSPPNSQTPIAPTRPVPKPRR